MKKFEITGTYKQPGSYKQKDAEKKFTKNVNSENEETAKEKVFSLIGGKQRIIRRNITILEVKEVETK
ncbi:MAG: 50S ribosomal protein L18Ae [Candidatus ainarchaeum sp.]|nr:50S ribosomal protein L18Ae [Candidatus ainarchaeum sp.]